MKLIIAGSRTLSPSVSFISSAINMLGVAIGQPLCQVRMGNDFGPAITEIVSGCAEGVDSAGEHWASHYGAPVIAFSANWDQFGKAAGPIRNKAMAEYADALLLIWDGSPGSKNMKEQMEKLGKPVYEVFLKRPF